MALNVTENLKQGLQNSQVTPTLVMRIDGYPNIFGNVQIERYIRIGDPGLLIGDDWIIGGFSLVDNQLPYITFNTGTTTKITQKLDPSRGLGSSVSQMSVSLVDRNEEIAELISPGFVLDDLLGRFVTVYLGIKESSWPEDYNVVFRGVIEGIDPGANTITLFLNNTEEKKRAAIFTRISTELAQTLNYRSVLFQDIFYKNREDVTNVITISLVGGGVAGSEVVTILGGTTIQVQIQDGISTAGQVKKAIENDPNANQLVELKIEGDNSTAQFVGSAVLGIDLTANIVDTSAFHLPADSGVFRTYILINDELIEYTGKTATTFTGLSRAQQTGNEGFIHQAEDDVEQVLRIKDNAINIALKLMLSGAPTYYLENFPIFSFVKYDAITIIDNAIFFAGIDVEVEHGVCKGDKVTVMGSGIGGNNVVDSVIAEVGKIDDGSYIILNDTLTLEIDSPATISIKSQFNTLPVGLKMLPKEVDVAQHLYVRDTYLPTQELDIYVKEISVGKDFLEREIYLPLSCFSVPRKGRSSIVIHAGPLPTYEIITLNRQTVENPEQLRVQRSLSENFFNQVVFNYNYNPVDDQFKTTTPEEEPFISPDTLLNRIPVGLRPFKITSRGLRSTSGAETIVERSAQRFLKRYQLGAEFIKGIKTNFKKGYQVEIGDIVAVDFGDLKLVDIATGNRSGNLKLMEVLNKTLDNKTGEVTLDVVNTIFGTSDRFGLISPASLTDVGSTTSKLILQKSYGTRSFERESNKWIGYIGQPVIVRDETFTTIYNTFIRGFDNNTPQGMSIDPIPAAPGANWIIESPNYPSSTDVNELAFWKQRHAFFAPQVVVAAAVGGGSQTEFEVDPADINKFFVGATVRIHNYGYTDDSPEALVIDVDLGTNIVTINQAAGFNIGPTHFVDLIGFADQQPAYRII